MLANAPVELGCVVWYTVGHKFKSVQKYSHFIGPNLIWVCSKMFRLYCTSMLSISVKNIDVQNWVEELKTGLIVKANPREKDYFQSDISLHFQAFVVRYNFSVCTDKKKLENIL